VRSDVCRGRPTSGTYDAITNTALDSLDQEEAGHADEAEQRLAKARLQLEADKRRTADALAHAVTRALEAAR